MSRLITNIKEKGEKYTQKLQKSIDNLIDTYFDQELSPTNPNIE